MKLTDEAIFHLTEGSMQKIFLTIARLSARQVLEELHLTPKFVTKSQAYKLYGRTQVKKWDERKLIMARLFDADGRFLYNVSELKAVAACEDIANYEMKLSNERYDEECKQRKERNRRKKFDFEANEKRAIEFDSDHPMFKEDWI